MGSRFTIGCSSRNKNTVREIKNPTGSGVGFFNYRELQTNVRWTALKVII